MIRVIDQDDVEHYVEDGTVIDVQTSWGEILHWKIVSCGDDEYHYEICDPVKVHGFCYHTRQVAGNLRNNGSKIISFHRCGNA